MGSSSRRIDTPDRVQRIRRTLQHPRDDEQRKRGRQRRQQRAGEHNPEDRQQHPPLFFAVQIGKAADEGVVAAAARRLAVTAQLTSTGGRMQLSGHHAEDRHDTGLQHRHGQGDDAQRGHEQAGPVIPGAAWVAWRSDT